MSILQPVVNPHDRHVHSRNGVRCHHLRRDKEGLIGRMGMGGNAGRIEMMPIERMIPVPMREVEPADAGSGLGGNPLNGRPGIERGIKDGQLLPLTVHQEVALRTDGR